LAQILITYLHQLPYSLGLALNDFFLFPRLKNHLRELHFDLDEDIKMIVALRRTSQDFKNYFYHGRKTGRSGSIDLGDYSGGMYILFSIPYLCFLVSSGMSEL
jgi:hypothetical protein